MKKYLDLAFQVALKWRHEFVTLEHLLLAFLESKSPVILLSFLHQDRLQMKRELMEYLVLSVPRSPLTLPAQAQEWLTLQAEQFTQLTELLVWMSNRPQYMDALWSCLLQVVEFFLQNTIYTCSQFLELPAEYLDIEPNFELQRVMQQAFFEAHKLDEEVDSVKILQHLFDDLQTYASRLLAQYSKPPQEIETAPFDHDNAAGNGRPTVSQTIRQGTVPFCEDLKVAHQKQRHSVVMGREAELSQCVQILMRQWRHNILLIGKNGIGKTALVSGLADRIAQKQVPPALCGASIQLLNWSQLNQGLRYKGEWEERLSTLIRALSARANTILFLDDLHLNNATSPKTAEFLNALFTALTHQKVRCIGAVTQEEYRALFEHNTGIAKYFELVELAELSKETTLAIVQQVSLQLACHYQLAYPEAILRQSIDLAERYLRQGVLPDKVIQVLDAVGALIREHEPNATPLEVDAISLQRTVAQLAHLSPESVYLAGQKRQFSWLDALKSRIAGQNSALNALASALEVIQAQLHQAKKPLGAFLLIGPSGVGKTETVLQLAALLRWPVVRLDMSEYAEKHTISRLIGAPPGYVGYDQGGLLSDAIALKPQSVLLLDEFEKAHPDFSHILLQILDYGTLTDAQGRVVDFRQTLILMTSNVGSQLWFQQAPHFAPSNIHEAVFSEVERSFTPEFLRRLTQIIVFEPLKQDEFLELIDKKLNEIVALCAEQSVVLQIAPSVALQLLQETYFVKLGIRALEQALHLRIKTLLARYLLSSQFKAGATIELCVSEQGEFELKPQVGQN